MSSLDRFWGWLANTELAFQIGATFWFPLIESIHVVGVGLVLGSILMVDLRLLGLAAKSYTVAIMIRETVSWSWFGFVLALTTGLGMFITRPDHYAANPAFQIKLLLLLLIGANVLVVHRGLRSLSEVKETLPFRVRLGAVLSLTLWIGVVLAGRWTGHLN